MSKTSNKSKLANLAEWSRVRKHQQKPKVTVYNK